jgi:Zn-dependent protease with chaperone function
MAAETSFRKDLGKVFGAALAALFVIPAAAFLFTQHVLPQQDEMYRQAIPFSPLWQFITADRVAFWTLVLGGLALLASLGLGALAFLSRRALYLSFLTGWRLLTLVAAIETIVQGALLVWLSFWVTAFFFNLYAIKLIAIAGIGAALAVFYAVVSIFRRPPQATTVEGELVSEQQAPALWARVRQLAGRLKTAPPDQIVAGIDANFFVTQSPLAVGEKAVKGRTLFVSLPLLRVLDRSEADAVLGHELAHFRGGDTASSAALGPMLVRYDHYCAMMLAGRVTLPVFYMMRMYRVIFEIALQRDSRAREFKADRTAAKLVSAQGIVHSLIKVAAYARYRAQIEQQLFEHDRQHDSLGIAGHVAAGLPPYATSAQFMDVMVSASIPHPFDSHPAMFDRMRNVGCLVAPKDYAAIVTRPTVDTWVSDIPPAADIEARLWGVYEREFAQAHERSLAYRYEPATEQERAIVLKYFPPVVVQLKGDKRIGISIDGLAPPEGDVVPWDSVKSFEYEDGIGGDVLKIVHPEKGWLGAKTTKVKLPGISKQRDQFKAVLAHYWGRHQIMRGQAAPD